MRTAVLFVVAAGLSGCDLVVDSFPSYPSWQRDCMDAGYYTTFETPIVAGAFDEADMRVEFEVDACVVPDSTMVGVVRTLFVQDSTDLPVCVWEWPIAKASPETFDKSICEDCNNWGFVVSYDKPNVERIDKRCGDFSAAPTDLLALQVLGIDEVTVAAPLNIKFFQPFAPGFVYEKDYQYTLGNGYTQDNFDSPDWLYHIERYPLDGAALSDNYNWQP